MSSLVPFVAEEPNWQSPPDAVRHRLHDHRRAVTRRIKIADLKIYVIVGLYPDGKPGELFVHADRVGSTISGLLDALSITVSMALQHGVPLKEICRKLQYMRFEPDGPTGEAELGIAKSIPDVIFRWLELRFCQPIELVTCDRAISGDRPHKQDENCVNPKPVPREGKKDVAQS